MRAKFKGRSAAAPREERRGGEIQGRISRPPPRGEREGEKEGEKKEKGELNSRADFRLPPRGEERGEIQEAGFPAAPERRGERREGEERREKGGAEKGERASINSRAEGEGRDFIAPERADFRLPPISGRKQRSQG